MELKLAPNTIGSGRRVRRWLGRVKDTHTLLEPIEGHVQSVGLGVAMRMTISSRSTASGYGHAHGHQAKGGWAKGPKGRWRGAEDNDILLDHATHLSNATLEPPFHYDDSTPRLG